MAKGDSISYKYGAPFPTKKKKLPAVEDFSWMPMYGCPFPQQPIPVGVFIPPNPEPTVSDPTTVSSLTTGLQNKIKEFQVKFGKKVGTTPKLAEIGLRTKLITEEVAELLEALDNADIVEAADALCDIIYVVLGAAVTWGVDLGPLMEEVHKTNMAKEGGGQRPDGKVMKPEGWKPPEIEKLLKEQGYAPNT